MQLIVVVIFSIVFVFNVQLVQSQCTSPVSSFPYQESFEASDGGWQAGGVNSDWTWGVPAKTNITTAGTGIRCWMTGGLTGNSYRSAQKSWLKSPCFDLSSLANPVIRFEIFWDTERSFDGAGFQYSLDNGSTWNNLGTVGNTSNCLTANWYNDGGIVYLGDPGWSGNTQPSSGSCLGGSGSWGWLVAQHDLSSLAGVSNVIFRFTFGSGTACNAFNGVAIDDIVIKEAAPGVANFNYTCGLNRQVAFTDSSSLCSSTISWNFGDPASGANNTSTLKDPVHVFSAPGNYIVTQTVSFPFGPPSIKTKTISIPDATISITPVRCFGENNGVAAVSIAGGSSGYSFSWNTTPPQTTATISNLKPGTYIVSINGTGACSIKDTAIITQPQPLSLSVNVSPEKCDNNNGSLTAVVTGGTAPYNYLWSNGTATAAATSLSAGSYSLDVTDARGCSIDTTNLLIINQVNPQKASLGGDTTICPGEKLVLSPGTFSSYRWQDNSSAPTFEVAASGTYSVQVTDADGCESSDEVKVEVICIDIFFPTGFTPNNDGKNDGFGPGGRLDAVKNYSLKIFSRYGDVVFQSSEPNQKWDGTVRSVPLASGSYIWYARYEIAGRKKEQKGTLVLIK